MFYHALTGNGGTAPVEDLSPVLLWENSNPTVGFEPQTISLDLTEYAGVIVEFNESSQVTNFINRSFIKKSDSTLGAGSVSGTNVAVARKVNCNDTGVTFGDGKHDASNNILLIPIKIYGVKEYVVEPVIGDLLWTNPNPAKAFNEQKISVDLSNAKGVLVEFMLSTNNQQISSRELIYKGETSFGVGYTSEIDAGSRNINAVENDGITISAGRAATISDNNKFIPYKIYAIN